MYNRYFQGEDGNFTRVTPRRSPPQTPSQDRPPSPTPPPPLGIAKLPGDAGRYLSRILEKFKLQDVDTGDILLLLILFFLFEEKADDELLIALGLLFIL